MPGAKKRLPLSDRMVEVVAARFQALGEPHRLRILQVLADGESAVGEITERLTAGQSNVSRHLQHLYDSGLVGRRREGNRILYSITDPTVLDICHLVCAGVERDARREAAEMSGRLSRKL